MKFWSYMCMLFDARGGTRSRGWGCKRSLKSLDHEWRINNTSSTSVSHLLGCFFSQIYIYTFYVFRRHWLLTLWYFGIFRSPTRICITLPCMCKKSLCVLIQLHPPTHAHAHTHAHAQTLHFLLADRSIARLHNGAVGLQQSSISPPPQYSLH